MGVGIEMGVWVGIGMVIVIEMGVWVGIGKALYYNI